MPLNPPGFSPPKWPRLGRRRDTAGYAAGLAPVPVDIPYGWLTPPLRSRPDKPITTAAVTRSGAATARAKNDNSLTEYGDNALTTTLHTACDADAANLAGWTLTHYATQPGAVPRARFPALTLNLGRRTTAERQLILEVTIGRRIRITDPPATWPQGATEQIVEGIRHSLGQMRLVEFSTSPVIGTSPGVAGPWFRFGHSSWGGPHTIPF